MNIRLLTIALLAYACTVQKRTSTTAYSTASRSHQLEVVHDSLLSLSYRRHIHNLEDETRSYIDIIPRGTVIWHPDSGFIGSADRIRIYLQDRRYESVHDNAWQRLTTGGQRTRENDATTAVSQQQTERHLQRKPISTWNFWLIAGAVLLALLVLWFIRRIRN